MEPILQPNICFGIVANGTLPGQDIFASLQNQKLAFWDFAETFCLELRKLQMKTITSVSRIFISSLFISDNQCPKIPYFRLLIHMNVQLKSLHSI